MKKILIIGASILQLPAIIKAKDKGFYVGVVDFNKDAIGVKFADEFFNVSTNDIDGIIKVSKSFKPDGIMTLATDMPMRSIAAATTELNLPGISYDTAVKATDKGEMIKTLEEHEVSIPWYFIVNNINDLENINIEYPCILKPVDSSGSRGVVLVNNKTELRDAFLYSTEYSKNGGVIIEEYMQGQEVSVEILAYNGDVNVLAVTDKLTTGQPYFVEMGHSQPSKLNDDKIMEIKDLAIKAVKAIGIECGPAHVEIMMTKTGPKIIELGARMGGDCITSHLVELSTGIDMVGATIDLLTNKVPNITPKYKKASAIRFLNHMEGKIKNITGIEDAKKINGIKVVEILKESGEHANEIKSSTDRIGFVISQSETHDNAIKICEEAINKIKINRI